MAMKVTVVAKRTMTTTRDTSFYHASNNGKVINEDRWNSDAHPPSKNVEVG